MNDFKEVEVLLVEDNPHDAELTLRALKKHHLANQVHWVQDGAEALEFIFPQRAYAGWDLSHKPRLLLLDLKLPKVDGLEVLRQIKLDPHTRAIPVVVLTSSREDRDLQECYQLGVNSYIVKPVDFEAFLKAVAEIGLYWLLLNKPSPGAGAAGDKTRDPWAPR
jgi:two-component system response regulator